METVVILLEALLGGWLVMAVAYLLLLAIVGMIPPRRTASPTQETPCFLLIIPAHNEERSLPVTLAGLQELEYPKDRYTVWIVADNCTDGTASVARAWGAECIERHDLDHRGKGYALQTAITQALETSYDAVVIFDVDADQVIPSHILRLFASRLVRGEEVVQTACRLVPQPGPWKSALAVANTIEERLFHSPRARLGCAAYLRGTGMCFSINVLRRFPFDCHSLAEDLQYTIQLLKSGVRVVLEPAATVTFDSPNRLSELAQQRTRWSRGHMLTSCREALSLLSIGISRKKILLCEFAMSLFLTNLTVLLGLALLGLIVSVAGYHVLEHPIAFIAMFTVALIGIMVYFGIGVALYKPSWREALSLSHLPLFVIWRLWTHVTTLLSLRNRTWIKTLRNP